MAFLLPGLGDHYPGMGQELYDEEPVYRHWIDRGAELLEERIGLDLRSVLHVPKRAAAPGVDFLRMLGRAPVAPDERAERLNDTALAHPAIFVVEHALAQLWRSLGVEPRALIGYSLGEPAGACLAGVLSFEDGLSLVAERARLIQGLPAGGMLAVQLEEREVGALLGPGLWIPGGQRRFARVVSGHRAMAGFGRARAPRRPGAAEISAPSIRADGPDRAAVPALRMRGDLCRRRSRSSRTCAARGSPTAEATDPGIGCGIPRPAAASPGASPSCGRTGPGACWSRTRGGLRISPPAPAGRGA